MLFTKVYVHLFFFLEILIIVMIYFKIWHGPYILIGGLKYTSTTIDYKICNLQPGLRFGFEKLTTIS